MRECHSLVHAEMLIETAEMLIETQKEEIVDHKDEFVFYLFHAIAKQADSKTDGSDQYISGCL